MTTEGAEREQSFRGAYPAERAAALAGVPLSTVYYWARQDIYGPGVSDSKLMLWSWADLLALRAIYWLRAKKPNLPIRPTTMAGVRSALASIELLYDRRLGEKLADKSLILSVNAQGECFVEVDQRLARSHVESFQMASSDVMLDLLAVYDPEAEQVRRGPHLLTPRPRLRIIPGKLGGEPHILDTRLETRSIAALLRRGLSTSAVLELYPFVSDEDVEEAADLEQQLDTNLGRAAA